MFNAFFKVIPNFYSCKANVETLRNDFYLREHLRRASNSGKLLGIKQVPSKHRVKFQSHYGKTCFISNHNGQKYNLVPKGGEGEPALVGAVTFSTNARKLEKSFLNLNACAQDCALSNEHHRAFGQC